jgi:catechol 2,3-dioxygenase-like lactoylglutathione lyase family enzyme
MKLEHVAINVPEPAKTAQWWAENLGMEIVLASDQSPYMHFVADTPRQSMMEFYNNPAAPMPDYSQINPFNLHVAFASDDIEVDRQRLLNAGATSAGDITTNPDGTKLAFLRDPWDVPFQLVQRAKPLL